MPIMSLINDFMSLIYQGFALAAKALYFAWNAYMYGLRSWSSQKQQSSWRNSELIRVFAGRCRWLRLTAFTGTKNQAKYSACFMPLNTKGKKETAEYRVSFCNLSLSSDTLSGMDGIIPVPLHRRRLKMRGYNQERMVCCGAGNPAAVFRCLPTCLSATWQQARKPERKSISAGRM